MAQNHDERCTESDRIELVVEGAGATRRLGETLGRWAPDGTVMLLHGDLGAGKTTLTQGIAAGMGVAEPVQSPTFTLVAEHDGAALRLFHLDLYRLGGPDELESLGFDQFLEPEGAVTVIEWPERAGRWLPADYLLIELIPAGPDRRAIALRPVGFVLHWNGLEAILNSDAGAADLRTEEGARPGRRPPSGPC